MSTLEQQSAGKVAALYIAAGHYLCDTIDTDKGPWNYDEFYATCTSWLAQANAAASDAHPELAEAIEAFWDAAQKCMKRSSAPPMMRHKLAQLLVEQGQITAEGDTP